MESTLVIKVKYEHTLRRFNARVDENENLDLDMVGLKAKILDLFSFPPDADLTLTYVDEDGDVVTLIDDNDLRDVMRQHLKFLRIDVSVNSEKGGRSYARSSGSSTPLRSPRGQQPFPDVSAIVAEAVKTLPEPLREVVSKISQDVASKAASPSATISDLVECFTKLGFQPLVGGNVGGDKVASATAGARSMAADTDAAKVEGMHDVMPNSRFGQSSSKECKDGDDGGVNQGGAVSAPPLHVPVDLNADLPGEANIFDGETKVEGHTISGGKTQDKVPEEFKKKLKKLNDQLKDQTSCQPGGKTKVAPENISGGKMHVKFLKAMMDKQMNDHTKDQASSQSAAFGESSSTLHNPGCVNPNSSFGPGFRVSFQQLHGIPPLNGIPLSPGLNAKAEVPNVLGAGGKTPFEVQAEAQKKVHDLQDFIAVQKHGAVEPFSGLSLADDWPFGHGACRRPHPFKRSSNYTDAMGSIFHTGIRCDGCGVYPITGPRFKSKVKEDYDLCSICFSAMGNVADYVRIDRPALNGAYRPPRHFKGYLHPWEAAPLTFPHPLRGCGGKSGKPKLDSRFVSDVTVVDGTVMAPSTPFTKIWRMRNNGNFVWHRGTQLVWIGGDKFSDINSVEIEVPAQGVPVDGELDIAIDFTAPGSAGRYISYWRMASSSGHKFGQRVWVLIQVDDSQKDATCDSFQGLNLNLPAESDESKLSEILDMNVPPAVPSDFFGNDNSNTVTEPVQPKVEQRKEEQDLNFPINDNLLVGQGVSASAPPEDSGPVLYPVVEVEPTEAIPTATAAVVPPPVIASTSAPSLATTGSDTEVVEKSLLKELEEMGFKEMGLNREILRMNAYNLEKSVDDLCGVAEWDPILGELQEMGFCDEETNKKLLKKNNGSIKRVVMDLLNGEKA